MEKEEKDVFGLTGLSNSRLSVTSVTQIGKVRVFFDRITVVGNLIESRKKRFKRLIETDPRIDLRDTGVDRFKCHALDNKLYVEYDRQLAKQLKRSEIRVEFNPSELEKEDIDFIKFIFLDNMRTKDFSRIDLAFDLPINLNEYYVMSDKALKKTIFYGRNDKPETKYFGVRDSERYIRIYNKKLQLSEVKKQEVEDEHLWRIEFELKRSMTNKWDKCFDDLYVLKPAWKTIENQQKRAMVYMLLEEQDEWANLQRRTKYRYKELIREISDVNITDILKKVLNDHHDKLSAELENYIAVSHHDKLYNFDFDF